jgi:hypothetical protein
MIAHIASLIISRRKVAAVRGSDTKWVKFALGLDALRRDWDGAGLHGLGHATSSTCSKPFSMQGAILSALAPHPEARVAVISALRTLEIEAESAPLFEAHPVSEGPAGTLPEKRQMSFPKIRSGLDSHRKAESSHH